MARLTGVLFLCLVLQLRAEFAFSPALLNDEPQSGRLTALAWSGDRLFAAGELGVIAYSDDLGLSWQQAEVPVSVTLTALSVSPGGDLWAVGHGGVILKGEAAGERWVKVFDGYRANEQFLDYARSRRSELEARLAALEKLPEPDLEQMSELELALEDAVFALDDAQFAMETGPADPFLDIYFIDEGHGLAVGAYGMLYHSIDAGESWQLDVSGIDNGYRNHLYSIGSDPSGRLYLSGEQGLLYYSQDAGRHWIRRPDVYDGSLFDVLGTGSAVYAMGLRGNLFRSVDGGLNWERVALQGSGSLYAGVVSAQGALFFVGSGGRIVSSLDGGLSFDEFTHPSRAGLADLSVRDGFLYLATDAGFIREELTEFTRE